MHKESCFSFTSLKQMFLSYFDIINCHEVVKSFDKFRKG